MLEKCCGTQGKKKSSKQRQAAFRPLFIFQELQDCLPHCRTAVRFLQCAVPTGYIASIYLPFFFPSCCHNDLLLQNCTLHDEEFTLHRNSLHQLCTVTITPVVAPLDCATGVRLADHGTPQLSV